MQNNAYAEQVALSSDAYGRVDAGGHRYYTVVPVRAAEDALHHQSVVRVRPQPSTRFCQFSCALTAGSAPRT
jgi:hypothetical protein